MKSDLISLSDHVYQRTRMRLDGLTDGEYFWEPAPDCWTVRRLGSGEYRADHVAPSGPPPVTTISWRLWHLIGCYGSDRNPLWLGLQLAPGGFDMHDGAAGSAADALVALERAHTRWHDILDARPDVAWPDRLGPIAGPYAASTRAGFVLHQLDEQIHHAAEIGVLRDLYRSTVERPDSH